MIREDLKYTKEHEWVRVEGDADVGVVGITHHAQDQLGDVVFVELPEVGAEVRAGATFGTVESVKAVSDLFVPVSGTVVEVNPALADTPEIVNTDPYGEGWMLKIELSNQAELEELLSASDYAAFVESSS